MYLQVIVVKMVSLFFFIRTCALFDICYRIYNKLRNHRNWNISSFDRLKSSKADSTCTFGLDDINSFYTH